MEVSTPVWNVMWDCEWSLSSVRDQRAGKMHMHMSDSQCMPHKDRISFACACILFALLSAVRSLKQEGASASRYLYTLTPHR